MGFLDGYKQAERDLADAFQLEYAKELAKADALQKPSLPEGLDEAAEEYGSRFIHPDCKAAGEYGFKAGAEWMAGQGISADSGVCKLANRAWVTPANEKKFAQDVFDNFVAGDKVIVQIRKK